MTRGGRQQQQQQQQQRVQQEGWLGRCCRLWEGGGERRRGWRRWSWGQSRGLLLLLLRR